MVTQESNLYIKLFSTLYTVRLVSCILSQLNILCTSLVKSHYTENDDSPIIHRSHVMATTCSPTYWILSKRSDAYIKKFGTLTGAIIVF